MFENPDELGDDPENRDYDGFLAGYNDVTGTNEAKNNPEFNLSDVQA